MNIPINANVVCKSELCGKSTSLIINPVNEQITHLVVEEKEFPNIKRLVPVNEIFESTSNLIQLRTSKKKFMQMEPFQETDFIYSGYMDSSLPYKVPYLVWPYTMYVDGPIQISHENMPAGEIEIRRGSKVFASDGKVGQVDEFLIDPKNNEITHLIMREGHLWGKKDITIPVSEIKKIDEDVVHLKLDKESIEKLPAISVSRRWK